MELEIFKPVIGFEGRFKISNYGRILSVNGRRLGEVEQVGTIDTLGYRSTTLRSCGKKWCVRFHTLVAMHFVENPNPKEFLIVNHIDGNKLNNHHSNLEWCTLAMNMAHAWQNGLVDNRGERSGCSILKEPQVLEIRRLYAEGLHKQKAIGEMFGISRRHISDIVNRVNWKHI